MPCISTLPSTRHDRLRKHSRSGRARASREAEIATRVAMRSVLSDVHFTGHLEDRVSSLSVAQRPPRTCKSAPFRLGC